MTSRGTKIGKYTTIHPTAIVGENCDIDDYVAVRKGSRVGDNTVIKCRATIGLDCSVGRDCFIGAHAILLNGKSGSESDPSHVCNNVFVGACVCILPGVFVCSNVMIGSGAVVTKNITEPGVYAGNPCRKLRS